MDNRLNEEIRAITGLIPITEFVENDVFIVGYGKSGNTWFQNLTSGMIYGVDPEYGPDTLIQELVPDVDYKRFYKRYRTPMFFKSHHLPRPDYRRVVYLLRDGRDVMVSYFHHLNAHRTEEVDFLKLAETGEDLYPSKWHEHVEAWLSNPYNAQMIIIKYEDLKTNPVNELRRFCAFVGEERDDQFLNLLAEKSSFQNMRQKEIRYGWDNPAWPKDKPFIRRGIIGSYKDEMPPNILEVFLRETEGTLRKCGYLNP